MLSKGDILTTENLFGRDYTLTITPDKTDEPMIYTPPMQIKFNIINSPDNSIATALITIYGLSIESRNRLRKQNVTKNDFSGFGDVSLIAGYEGETSEIFNGEINFVEIGYEGPDLYTRLYCAAKQRKWTETVINRSWGENTPALEVMTDIAKAYGLRVEINGNFSDIQPFVGGYSTTDLAYHELDRMSYAWGFTWRLTNDAVIITRKDAVRPDSIHEISAKNGMESTPRFYFEQTEVDIKMDGRIHPDDVAHITSDFWTVNYSGVYYTDIDRLPQEMTRIGKFKVLSTSHEGDFWGDTWKTTLSCYWYGATS